VHEHGGDFAVVIGQAGDTVDEQQRSDQQVGAEIDDGIAVCGPQRAEQDKGEDNNRQARRNDRSADGDKRLEDFDLGHAVAHQRGL
jgi:hypothetical protein